VLEDEDQEEILEKMCGLLGRSFNTPETRAWIVSAITKMASRMEHLPDFVLNSIATFLASEDHDIQQRCLELCALSENTQLMKEVLPLDASCEDLEVDHSLSFLDEYVADALQKGSAPYVPAYLREEAPKRKSVQKTAVEGFRFEPYAPPPVVVNPSILASATSTQPTSPIALTVEPIAESTTATAKLESEEYTQPMTAGIDVKKPVWGKGGFIKKKTQTVPIEYREDYDGTRSYGNQEVNSDSNSASVESGNVDGKTPESRGEPPTSPAVELSEEERKKQVLAQALFGGGGGFGKAGALSGPGRAPKSKRKQLVTSPTVPKESTAPITHSPKPTKPPPKQSDVDLLLDLGDLSFDGSGQSSVTNGSSLTTEPVQAPKMDGLFAGLQNSSSSSFGSTGQAAPLEQSSLLDTKQPPSNQDQLGVLGLLGENPGISLPGDLEACPHTNNEDLCQDGLVRVSAVKVYKPSELVVVLSFTSMRQKDTSISLSLSLPSNCQCSVDGAAVSLSPASTTVGMVVSAFGTVQKMIILTPQGPSPQMSIHGDLTYKEDIVGKKQFFDYQVQTVDMLRPQQMVTKEFGKNWGTLVHKKREKIPSSRITTPKEFHEFVQKMFRFHPIEIIGKEAIAAAVFLPSSLCLLHCKVLQSSSTLELSVLSNNSLLTNCVGKEITAALSE
jgi:AP-4 complex subunit epsilon-1